MEQDKAAVHVSKIILLKKILNLPIAVYDEYYHFASVTSEQFHTILSKFELGREQLAMYLDIDKTTIARWKAGKTFISRNYFNKLMLLK